MLDTTCFPLTKTVVIKGLMLSTVCFNNELQNRTTSQQWRLPAK